MKLKKVFIGAFIILVFSFVIGTKKVLAASSDFTVYTNNCPGIEDWKHEFYKQSSTNTFMAKNITGWVKKDVNPIQLSYQESVTGTVSYSATSTDSITVGANLMGAAIEGTKSLSRTLSYSYSKTTINAFTWTINPNESGNYFCLAVNYKTRTYKVDHYKQAFKWFGQGDYNYKSTSYINIPTEKYLAKNYRYEIDGVTYEK